jgi:protein canopy 1/2
MTEMEAEISKVDPKKKIEVGGFRIDKTGDTVSKTVQLVKSETFLTELMETVCKYI